MRRSRAPIAAAVLLATALSAPVAVHAEAPEAAADAPAAALAPASGSSGGDPAGFRAVAAGPSWAETGGYDAIEATRAAAPGLITQSAAGGIASAAPDEDEWLAIFRAVDRRILAEYEGAAQPEGPSCDADG
jgi:hypothetical protein